jgi:hypothetical protein
VYGLYCFASCFAGSSLLVNPCIDSLFSMVHHYWAWFVLPSDDEPVKHVVKQQQAMPNNDEQVNHGVIQHNRCPVMTNQSSMK